MFTYISVYMILKYTLIYYIYNINNSYLYLLINGIPYLTLLTYFLCNTIPKH